jgi:hypothetical protein
LYYLSFSSLVSFQDKSRKPGPWSFSFEDLNVRKLPSAVLHQQRAPVIPSKIIQESGKCSSSIIKTIVFKRKVRVLTILFYKNKNLAKKWKGKLVFDLITRDEYFFWFLVNPSCSSVIFLWLINHEETWSKESSQRHTAPYEYLGRREKTELSCFEILMPICL